MNYMEKEKMVNVSNLELILSNRVILDNLSFQILSKSISCIIGPNGSGKTSLLRAITGYYTVSKQSRINYFGHELNSNEDKIKANLIYIPDEDTLELDLTGIQFIRFVNSFYDRKLVSEERVNTLVRLFDMEGVLNDSVLTYSHGMVKKICLIAYLSVDVDVLILDEPFNGLDPEHTKITFDLLVELKKLGKSILLTSHNLSIVQKIADKVFILIKGKESFNGNLEQLLEKIESKNLEDGWLELIGVKEQKESQIYEYTQSFPIRAKSNLE